MRERGDGTLRVSDRREIIQVGAALSKRADRFLAKHPDKVDAVKQLFTLRLAHVPRQSPPGWLPVQGTDWPPVWGFEWMKGSMWR
jgi:hypothetical protein